MKTIDIHTHLMNPAVCFDRLYDKITIRFFAKSLGVDPKALMRNPYAAYVDSMANSIRQSAYVNKACLFGVDARFDEQGSEIHRDKTVCAMTEDVVEVAARYPEQFIPFMSINPRRHDALERIDAYAEQGCRGAKFLQNYWGVDLNDERFIAYYEKLVAHDLPLIVHVGSEYTVQSDGRYEGIDMVDLPLACGVKVIAAHMGLGRINYKLMPWRNLSRNPKYFDRDYFQLLEKLEQHDNLFADVSAILAPLRARALRHLAQALPVHDKILFGTDFPVPYAVRFNTYDLERMKRRQFVRIENPFDRYLSVLFEYFPADSAIYTNHQKLLSI
jgi:uncharacterized protein